VANLVGLLQLLTTHHYEKLWDQLKDRKPLKDFLLRIFLVFRNLIRQDVFPVDWLVMKMKVNSVLLSSLQQIKDPLKSHFLGKWQFDCQVRLQYLYGCST
jgi:dedicator of cytokinesis protein 3